MQVGTILTLLITAAVSRLRSTEQLHTVPHVVVTLAEHANYGPFVALVALVGLCLALSPHSLLTQALRLPPYCWLFKLQGGTTQG